MDIRPNHCSWTCIAAVLAWVSWGWGQEQRGLPELGMPESFGVNIHFTSADGKQLEALSGSGVRFIRMDFGWGGTERSQGEYDFGAYDRLVGDMSKLGIRCLLILDYSNRLYDGGLSPHTEEGRGAFARWAAAGAAHFKGKGILWEIWNEPNISQFWKPRPNADDYSKLALVTIEAIRKADPEAFIMAPASSAFPWEFFEAMGRAGVFGKLGALSVHPYRQQNPETAEADYCRLRLLLEQYAPGRKLAIVSGEWGYSTAWGGMNDEKQANYLVRQRLMNLWMGVPLSIWYDWHDDGPDPKEPEHHFGTVYLYFRPKPSYIAGKVLAETLGGYRYVRREVGEGSDDYLLLFRKGDDAALVVWNSKEGNVLTLRDDLGPFALVSREGKRKVIGPGSEVSLGASPQYIHLDRAKGARLAWWQPAETMTVLGSDGRGPINVVFDAPAGQAVKGRVEVTAEGDDTVIGRGVVEVRGGRKQTISVPVRYPRRDRRASLATVHVILEGEKESQTGYVWLLSGNPLGVWVLPPVGREAAVLLENPSGQGIGGELHVKAGGTTAKSGFRMQSGQTQTVVTVPLAGAVSGTESIVAEVVDGSGQLVAQPGAVRWAASPKVSRDSAWRAIVDGDSKVPGKADVSVSAVKASCPQAGFEVAVEVRYRFGSGWRYIAVSPPADGAKIEGKPTKVGMWIHGDVSGNTLRCRYVDSSGQTFQPTYGEVTWKGWKWIEMPMDGREAGHWGGAKDGEVHYPIRWDAVFLIDNMNGKVNEELVLQATGFAVGF